MKPSDLLRLAAYEQYKKQRRHRCANNTCNCGQLFSKAIGCCGAIENVSCSPVNWPARSAAHQYLKLFAPRGRATQGGYWWTPPHDIENTTRKCQDFIARQIALLLAADIAESERA